MKKMLKNETFFRQTKKQKKDTKRPPFCEVVLKADFVGRNRSDNLTAKIGCLAAKQLAGSRDALPSFRDLLDEWRVAMAFTSVHVLVLPRHNLFQIQTRKMGLSEGMLFRLNHFVVPISQQNKITGRWRGLMVSALRLCLTKPLHKEYTQILSWIWAKNARRSQEICIEPTWCSQLKSSQLCRLWSRFDKKPKSKTRSPKDVLWFLVSLRQVELFHWTTFGFAMPIGSRKGSMACWFQCILSRAVIA